MKWVELQVYPDILELPFRGTPACGLPVLHAVRGNSVPLERPLSPPTPAGTEELSVWAPEALFSWAPQRRGAARSWRRPLAFLGPKQAWPLGPRWLDSSEMDRSGGIWCSFHTSPASKLGLSLFGRGFEKRHAWGAGSLAGFNHLVFGSGHLVCRVHHGRNGPP